MIQLPPVTDDGLKTPVVGPWSKRKYRLIALYCDMFMRSMRSKWDILCYVDLFSGSGISRIRDTATFLPGSPIIALSTEPHFDKYIFCDDDADNARALAARARTSFQDRDATIINADANAIVDDILMAMPTRNNSQRMLTLCVVDPFRVSNLSFDTIRKLSTLFVDFLILIPTGMDINRNKKVYLKDEINALDRFMGDSEWRADWKIAFEDNDDFRRFILLKYHERMARLKYLTPNHAQSILFRSDGKNLNLYRLVLYSRHSLGGAFWEEARKYAEEQLELGV